ncbi:helix-turn-helix domain-containing protein [Mammaliicoccus sciuri]|uniref:helix-turn-helix domain-containing protein n=1 Tax=Mammaliicoccus sciuri TaxID=1296 RepID=UPI0028861C1A|nr:helix-turn-helix domain-containing protein [Mammaliicoccus sciuri]MDT0670217.1 helix-turn-helix domain-containing protein [Mammaliicoccus sciuri]
MTINKMPLEERIKLVEDIIGGNLTIYSATKTHGVSSATLQEWVRRYKAYGEEGLKPFGKRTKYTSELKAMAIEDILEKNIPPYKVVKKYDISSIAVLKFWVKNYNKGKSNKHTGKGFSTMSKSRKTTLSERIEITENTIAKIYNYQEASEEYCVSYQQIYNWVRKYKENGIDGLKDKRGKNKQQELSEIELIKLENKKLKTRIEYLEMDKAILKKWQEFKYRNNHFH